MTSRVYDAHQEHQGWTNTAYDDNIWQLAHLTPGPAGLLHPQIMPSIRPAGTASPSSVRQTATGVWMVDLGVDIAE